MAREDQYNVTVTVTRKIKGGEETKILGTFDKMSGGEVDSEESTYYPGGMGNQKQYGGRRKVGNVTVSRVQELERDLADQGWLMDGVGKAKVNVTKQALDIDGASYGKALVYVGILKMVTPTEPDSESTDVGLFELEVSSATVTQN